MPKQDLRLVITGYAEHTVFLLPYSSVTRSLPAGLLVRKWHGDGEREGKLTSKQTLEVSSVSVALSHFAVRRMEKMSRLQQGCEVSVAYASRGPTSLGEQEEEHRHRCWPATMSRASGTAAAASTSPSPLSAQELTEAHRLRGT